MQLNARGLYDKLRSTFGHGIWGGYLRQTKHKILVIGRRKPVKGDRFGGVVTAFEAFLTYLNETLVPHDVIDINHQNYPFRVWFVLRSWAVITGAILIGSARVISLQGTNRDLIWFAPLVICLARLTGKRVTIRKIGGDFDQFYKALHFPQKSLIDYVLTRSDTVFFETRFLVREFEHAGQVDWFPNMRKASTEPVVAESYKRRFLFLSRVEKSKGVDEILEAIPLLPDLFTVDIYGPDFGYIPPPANDRIFRDRYKGSVEPGAVSGLLDNYDVLILPTQYLGEGYPGILLEAYTRGLPVITTRWRAIPEIVDDGKTGFLISPGSPRELADAMLKITEENYSDLSAQALKFAESFDSERLMPNILDVMQGVTDGT